MGRRSSSFLQELFQQKQRFTERSEEVEKSPDQLTVSSANVPLILPPTKESATSALQVTHYINALLVNILDIYLLSIIFNVA